MTAVDDLIDWHQLNEQLVEKLEDKILDIDDQIQDALKAFDARLDALTEAERREFWDRVGG